MVFKAFKVYTDLKPQEMVNETIAMAMEKMTTTCSANDDKGEVVATAEEVESMEWEVEVDSGVFITFVSQPQGGNLLKKIRFRYMWSFIFFIFYDMEPTNPPLDDHC